MLWQGNVCFIYLKTKLIIRHRFINRYDAGSQIFLTLRFIVSIENDMPSCYGC